MLIWFLKEPSANGPLFTELKFYMRAAKPELSKYTVGRFLFNKTIPLENNAYAEWGVVTYCFNVSWAMVYSGFLMVILRAFLIITGCFLIMMQCRVVIEGNCL